MNAWMSWLAIAGVVVILELVTGTFYLLMISIGLVAAALAAYLGASGTWQIMIAAVVGAASTLALHRSQFGYKARGNTQSDPSVNMDIGQTITVSEWQEAGQGKFTSRTMYRGAQWDIDLQNGTPHSGVFLIVEVVGSRLIVTAT